MEPSTASLSGNLLIAGPALFDPNFRRTVVLIGHHDEEGAVGVVLNRALELTVDEVVPDLGRLVPPGDRLHAGGPVQPDGAVILADFQEPAEAEVLAFGTIGFMPPDRDPLEMPVRRARVFVGYSGWGAGQLEAELEEEAWIVEPAVADDVFAPEPERLWERVLARMGTEVAMLRLMPEDPSLN
ncbi:MAG: YqgE/AlgH family protein [Actinomycetota bacterium]